MHEIYCHAGFCLVLKLISFIAEQKEVDFFFLRGSGAEYQNIPVFLLTWFLCEGPNSYLGPRGCLMFSLICAVVRRLNLEALHWG